mgnify:CR=1 FL=1
MSNSKSIDSSFEVFYNRAVSFLNLGLYEKAILDFNKVLALSNMNSDAFLYRGFCYKKLNQHIKGCEDINTAVKLGSKTALNFLKGC